MMMTLLLGASRHRDASRRRRPHFPSQNFFSLRVRVPSLLLLRAAAATAFFVRVKLLLLTSLPSTSRYLSLLMMLVRLKALLLWGDATTV